MYVASTNQPRTFVKAYHDVLKSPALNPTDKLVYLTLLSYQEAGLQVFPSNEHVAESLSISKDSVIRATSKLVKLGAIEKTRRFNKSNLVTVNTLEAANCNVQRSQNATSRGSKVQLYKNRNNIKNKISKEAEGQNPDASLSHGNGLLDDTDLTDKPDFIGDESFSDFNLAEQEPEQKEEVIDTYASMHSEALDCSSRDYSTVQFDDDEPDLSDEDDEQHSEPVGLKTPEQSYRDLLHKSANRVTALNKKPKQYNSSQPYRSAYQV